MVLLMLQTICQKNTLRKADEIISKSEIVLREAGRKT